MKIFILYLLKWLGIFKAAKYCSRKKLLILAYHGVEINDESLFNPMFIKRSTFEQRMEYLKKGKFNVLGLSEAIQMLHADSLPINCVVITFDDGWYSTMHHAANILAEKAFRYTIYVTSYYVKYSNVPVLNVALLYLIWACNKQIIRLDQLGIPKLSGTYSLLMEKERYEMQQILVEHFNSINEMNKRIEFIRQLADLFNADYDKMTSERKFGLLSFLEIKYLSEQGVDIQLHSHIHYMELNNKQNIMNNIRENKSLLQPYVNNRLEHFCYPSGRHNPACESVLRDLGISSAATCEPGYVTKNTNVYYLPRYLDMDNTPQIVFEAELCGIMNLLRKIHIFGNFIGHKQ